MQSHTDHIWSPPLANHSDAHALTPPNGPPALEPSFQPLDDDHLSEFVRMFHTDPLTAQQCNFLETSSANLQRGQTSGLGFDARDLMASNRGVDDILKEMAEATKEGDTSAFRVEDPRAPEAAVAQQIDAFDIDMTAGDIAHMKEALTAEYGHIIGRMDPKKFKILPTPPLPVAAVAAMTAEYARNPKPSGEWMQNCADMQGLTKTQVVNWFSNRRRRGSPKRKR